MSDLPESYEDVTSPDSHHAAARLWCSSALSILRTYQAQTPPADPLYTAYGQAFAHLAQLERALLAAEGATVRG